MADDLQHAVPADLPLLHEGKTGRNAAAALTAEGCDGPEESRTNDLSLGEEAGQARKWARDGGTNRKTCTKPSFISPAAGVVVDSGERRAAIDAFV